MKFENLQTVASLPQKRRRKIERVRGTDFPVSSEVESVEEGDSFFSRNPEKGIGGFFDLEFSFVEAGSFRQGAVGGPVFQTRQILQGQGEDLPAELELVADADSVGDSLAGIAFHEGTVVRAAHVLHKNFENVSLLCGEGKFMRFVVAVDGCLMRAVQIHQGAVAGFVDHDGLILNVADQFCAVENESE